MTPLTLIAMISLCGLTALALSYRERPLFAASEPQLPHWQRSDEAGWDSSEDHHRDERDDEDERDELEWFENY